MAGEPENIARDGARRNGVGFEWVFAGAILMLGALALGRAAIDGFLPQPFYFHVDNTGMDLYSIAFWANNPGAYTRWKSIYPPLSFLFMRLISVHECYSTSPIIGRSCDWRPLAALITLFTVNIWLVFFSFKKMNIKASMPRTVAVCVGLPMLYTLERGNLLLPCFTCFVLAFGDLLRWRVSRWLAMALAINFKPYLAFSVLAFLGRRAWGGLLVCAVLFSAIYGFTYLKEGMGSPVEVISDELQYAGLRSVRFFSDVYFATSYWPLIRLLRASPPGLALAPHVVAEAISLGLEILIRLYQVGFFACCAVAILRPAAIDVRRFGAMVACISLMAFTTGSAGYVEIFLFFLLFYEPWRGTTRIVMLTSAYLLCLPFDWMLLPVVHDHAVSYLSGRMVTTTFGLSVGQVVRPGVLMIIQFCLIAINFQDLLRPGAGSRDYPPNPFWFSTSSWVGKPIDGADYRRVL